QVGQPPWFSVVVTALFVGEQQSRILCACFGGGNAILRVQQDRARVRSQNFGDRRLELGHHVRRDLILRNAFGRRNHFLQAAALVHGGGRNHAVLVRK